MGEVRGEPPNSEAMTVRSPEVRSVLLRTRFACSQVSSVLPSLSRKLPLLLSLGWR